MAHFVLRREAQLDLEEAALWYDDQQTGLGERFSAELKRVLQRISESPFQFPHIDRGIRRGLLQRYPYAVYFTVSQETVIVLAVLHQSRDASRWRGRE